MAGIKNIYQMYGSNPYETIEGDSIIERNLNFSMRRPTPYCQLCGNEIIESDMDSNGSKVDYHWEIQHLLHMKCINREMNR